MKEVTLTYSIKPAWDVVQQIETKINELYKPANPELLSSTSMAVSELIENAVKYSDSSPDKKSINLNFLADNKSIIIIISNPVTNQNHVDMVTRHIERIQNTDDPQKLYIERLQQLLDNPKITYTQLGLYRIAYEGKFQLSYGYESNILTVKALRKIKID
jgi:hypothetical protein